MRDNPRFIVIEDDAKSREDVIKALTQVGWVLVGEFNNYLDAFDFAQTSDLSAVDAAVVDGNLTEGSNGSYEGARINRQLTKHNPNILLIGYSGDKGKPIGCDFYLGKWITNERIAHLQSFASTFTRE